MLVERSAALRDGAARAARRSNRPTRRSGPFARARRRRAGSARRHRAGVRRRSTTCPRSRSTASCSPTSCSTTCRSASRSGTAPLGGGAGRVDGDGLVEVLVPAKPTTRSRLATIADGSRSRRAPGCRSRAASRRGCERVRSRAAPRRGRGRSTTSTTRPGCSIAARRAGCAPTARTNAGADPLDAPGDAGHHRRRRASSNSCAPPARRVSARARHVAGRVAARRSASTSSSPTAARSGRQRAHVGDLEAVAGRSRVDRSRRAVDPAGLGAHRVVILAVTTRLRAPALRLASLRRTRREGAEMAETMATRSKRCCSEGRTFPPPESFRKTALDHRRVRLRRGRTRLAGLLGRAGARARLDRASGTPSSSGTCRSPKWFVGGKLNVAYNCLDRHVEAGHGDQVAFHWEGEPGDTRTITYARAARRDVPSRQRC